MSLAGFIAAPRAEHGIPHSVACRALGVSPAWFYKWRHGEVFLRRQRRAALAAQIRYLFSMHNRCYGSPRIAAELRDLGWQVRWHKRIWRCREPGCPQVTWTEDHAYPVPHAKLIARATSWSVNALLHDDTTVSAIAHHLGGGSGHLLAPIKNAAKTRIAQPDRLKAIKTIGVDEHIWTSLEDREHGQARRGDRRPDPRWARRPARAAA